MTRTRRKLGLTAALGLIPSVALLGAGCAPAPEGGAGDAPIAGVEQEGWIVLNNIDGFPNVATRCRRNDGLYVTRSSGDQADTLVVIPNDPACSPPGTTLR